MKLYLAVLAVLASLSAQAAELRGKIVSVTGGEPLRQVQVTILELKRSVVTGDDGAFAISAVPPGKYTLRVSAVGFRLVTTAFQVAAENDNKEFSIALAPDNFRRVDTVEVRGDVFDPETPALASDINLTASELKEASTVFADDPFRSVQSLPGVSASDNNDFFGEFSVLGTPFQKVSVYVDDVLTPSPFHSIPGFRDGASLSVFSSETVQSLDLMPVAYPARYADATGAALAVQTREGSRAGQHFTASIGMADSDLIGEGKLARSGKGSWLVSARKSYLDYLVHHASADPFTNVGFEDADGKLVYDFSRRQNISLYFLEGHTDVSRHDPANTINDLNTGGNDFNLGRAGWKFALGPQLLLDSYGAYVRQDFSTKNFSNQLINHDDYQEWAGATRITWNWSKDHVLESGYTGRRLNDSSEQVFFTSSEINDGVFQGSGYRQSGFTQETSTLLNHKLHVMAGLRWDHLQRVAINPLSPQASLAWQMTSGTTLHLGFGRYAQLSSRPVADSCIPAGFTVPPGIQEILPAGLVDRSNHYVAGIEQRLGEDLRIKVEGYARENHDFFGERLINSSGCGPVQPTDAASISQLNSRDYTRGAQIIIQRRSANRLSGWLGYSLNYARERMLIAGNAGLATLISAPAPEDQRHTLNAFAMYRLTPSINLSGKLLFGSGMPVTPLQFQAVGDTFVPVGASSQRLPEYQRLDLRLDKAWAFARWKLTLYAEVLNVTNHNNPRFILSSFNPLTGVASAVTEKGLPVTPTAGLSFEF